MTQYLDEIIRWHRDRAREDAKARDLESELIDLQDASNVSQKEVGVPFGFSSTLVKERNSNVGIGIIAELKRRSPSKGDLNPELDPIQTAQDFVNTGATCLSVLTDEKFFGGCLADLTAIKKVVGIPILRKDFTVSSLDVCDAKRAGADAVLLIMAVLTDEETREYHATAVRLGLDTIFEVHTLGEIKRVKEITEYERNNIDKYVDKNMEAGNVLVPPVCILLNQRNLKTFEEHPTLALELAEEIITSDSTHDGLNMIPKAIAIAASAINSPQAVRDIKDAGYSGVLVGEYLMRSRNPKETLRTLLEISLTLL